MFDKLQKKDIWQIYGNGFCLEIYHYYNNCKKDEWDDGKNRWNIYCYIYPKHPLFSLYKTDDDLKLFSYVNNRFLNLFHGGISYCNKYIDPVTLKVMSIKIGCDYNHLYDTDYTFIDVDDFNESCIIYYNAEQIFQYFENFNIDKN